MTTNPFDDVEPDNYDDHDDDELDNSENPTPDEVTVEEDEDVNAAP